MVMLKQRIIDGIISTEGGYVNDPSDSGGETKYGITERVARSYGYIGDMRYMPQSVAYEIYSHQYWSSLKLDDIVLISERLAEELADTGVNMGVGRAAEFLQRSLNVLNNRGELYNDIVVDGAVGPMTLNALYSFVDARGKSGINVLLKMLNSLQGSFYIRLAERREKDERFIFGWFKNRVA